MPPYIKLTVELAGTDPTSSVGMTIALVTVDRWQEGVIPASINAAFDRAYVFAGAGGLKALRRWDVHMLVGLYARGINPAFFLDEVTIHRFSQCRSTLDFDPYIHEMPAGDSDTTEENDFIVRLSAVEPWSLRTTIATQRPGENSGSDDVCIRQLFIKALNYHGDNSLQKFREKQLMFTLNARYHEDETQLVEGCYASDEDYIRPGFHLNRDVFIRLNAARARFHYCPFGTARVPERGV